VDVLHLASRTPLVMSPRMPRSRNNSLKTYQTTTISFDPVKYDSLSSVGRFIASIAVGTTVGWATAVLSDVVLGMETQDAVLIGCAFGALATILCLFWTGPVQRARGGRSVIRWRRSLGPEKRSVDTPGRRRPRPALKNRPHHQVASGSAAVPSGVRGPVPPIQRSWLDRMRAWFRRVCIKTNPVVAERRPVIDRGASDRQVASGSTIGLRPTNEREVADQLPNRSPKVGSAARRSAIPGSTALRQGVRIGAIGPLTPPNRREASDHADSPEDWWEAEANDASVERGPDPSLEVSTHAAPREFRGSSGLGEKLHDVSGQGGGVMLSKEVEGPIPMTAIPGRVLDPYLFEGKFIRVRNPASQRP